MYCSVYISTTYGVRIKWQMCLVYLDNVIVFGSFAEHQQLGYLNNAPRHPYFLP